MNISNPLHKKEPVNTPQAGMPTGSDKLRCSSLYTDGIVEQNPARAARWRELARAVVPSRR